MLALVATAAGTFSVDLDSEEVGAAEPFRRRSAAAAQPAPGRRRRRGRLDGRRAVDARPPLLVSYDAAPPGASPDAVFRRGAQSRSAEADPDTLAYAARNRLYVSRDGGVFWTALAVELPEIEALDLVEG